MKNQVVTEGIVLSRTDFQEADRILTILTPEQGKLSVIAKGVRRAKSKLAGGIELFSISSLTLLPGRGEMHTLVSSRLETHYGNIVKDIQHTMLAYELLKRTNRMTEDAPESDYFHLLQRSLESLDDLMLSGDIVELWFTMQLLVIGGHAPELQADTEAQRLAPDQQYVFEYDAMAFRQQKGGQFGQNHIKLLRLAYAADNPSVLKPVADAGKYLDDCMNLLKNIVRLQTGR